MTQRASDACAVYFTLYGSVCNIPDEMHSKPISIGNIYLYFISLLLFRLSALTGRSRSIVALNMNANKVCQRAVGMLFSVRIIAKLPFGTNKNTLWMLINA